MSIVHRLLCSVGVHHWMVHSDPETRAPFQEGAHFGEEWDMIALASVPFHGLMET